MMTLIDGFQNASKNSNLQCEYANWHWWAVTQALQFCV